MHSGVYSDAILSLKVDTTLCLNFWRIYYLKFLLVSNSKNYGKILWPVVIGLGWLLNQVFIFETKILHFPETGSVALAITILTFVIYMALFPLTWKQQKFSILSKKMNPEIQKIQKK